MDRNTHRGASRFELQPHCYYPLNPEPVEQPLLRLLPRRVFKSLTWSEWIHHYCRYYPGVTISDLEQVGRTTTLATAQVSQAYIHSVPTVDQHPS